jgi:hypothetical protein
MGGIFDGDQGLGVREEMINDLTTSGAYPWLIERQRSPPIGQMPCGTGPRRVCNEIFTNS